MKNLYSDKIRTVRRNVTMRCSGFTIVALKSNYYYIFRASACSLRFPERIANTSVLSSLSYFGFRTLIPITLQTARFSGDIIEHKMFVILPPQILSETLIILTRIRRDFLINEHASSCKLPIIIVEF